MQKDAELAPGRGRKVVVDGVIRFTNVPIVTPNQEMLVGCRAPVPTPFLMSESQHFYKH